MLEYKLLLKNIENLPTKKEKILYILNWLITHNKNLTKTQYFLIDDLIEIIKRG